MDYRAVCLDVCELAREAGAYIARQRERFTFSDVEFKGAQNLVSYVDKQTERTLVERLKALVPEAEFVTEREPSPPPVGRAVSNGSSIRSTGRPISCTGFRPIASVSR